MISAEIKDRVLEFTDAGQWKASWHWDRTPSGAITLQGAKQMLRDLGCDDEGKEMIEALQKIRRRYELAAMIQDAVQREEKRILEEAENWD